METRQIRLPIWAAFCVAFFASVAVVNANYIMASASSGGSVYPAGETLVKYGDDLELTATADPGYLVNTWSVDGAYAQTGGTHFVLTDVRSTHSVLVSFVKRQFAINASAGPGGSISPSDVKIPYGDLLTFTAWADVGYQVDKWFLDGDLVQTGQSTYEIGPVFAEHKLHVTFVEKLSYSLGNLDFEDDDDFEDKVISNNTGEPDETVVFVEALGLGADPDNIAMGLRNRTDDQGNTINARAKAVFIQTGIDQVLIRFSYLFIRPDAELVVYLSDSPLLLASDDPLRAQHYIEIARVAVPPYPRPGSPGSDRFAIFRKRVWTGALDLSQGLYIELELVDRPTGDIVAAGLAPGGVLQGYGGGSSVYVDEWSTHVQCFGICLDINWDNFVDEADFLMVISGSGLSASGNMACVEGSFSGDGYMDSYDVASWDWAMNSDLQLLSFCGLPLTGGAGGPQLGSMRMLSAQGAPKAHALAGGLDALSDLLILGKRGPADAASKLGDALYTFDSAGQHVGSVELASDRGNLRIVQGLAGELYQLNSETGLQRLDDTDDVIVPSGQLELTESQEPRYGKPGTVYVGIQDLGAGSFGRPVLDAAVDAEHAYVVPVVVSPVGARVYTAAAKLRLLPSGNPPYELVELYDEPPLPNDNQYRDSLREIELDAAGNVYVLNANSLNESDILWRFKPDGAVDRLDLGRPGSANYVPAPIAMFASKTTDMLYLTSALLDPVDSESTTIYGFSTQGPLTLAKSINVLGLQHVTSMTEDPLSGTLWVAGYFLLDPPLYPNPTQPAFYYAQVAKLPSDGSDYKLLPLYAPVLHDLSLPMSILWTGPGQ